MICRRTKRPRRGSALLLCTLAAAVLSMATIAIVRSNQRGVIRVDATRTSLQSRATAEGLTQRTLAMLKVDPSYSGEIRDERTKNTVAWVDVRQVSKTTSSIEVYLYKGSTTPMIRRIVDVEALGKDKKDKDKKDKDDKGKG